MTGILFDHANATWNVFIDRPDDGRCVGCAATAEHAMQILDTALAQVKRQQSKALDEQSNVSSNVCMRVRAMRRFFGFAVSAGLDTAADDAMRSALGNFLGRYLWRRKAVSACEWMVCGDAVQAGILIW
jgi:hypothetical protein